MKKIAVILSVALLLTFLTVNVSAGVIYSLDFEDFGVVDDVVGTQKTVTLQDSFDYGYVAVTSRTVTPPKSTSVFGGARAQVTVVSESGSVSNACIRFRVTSPGGFSASKSVCGSGSELVGGSPYILEIPPQAVVDSSFTAYVEVYISSASALPDSLTVKWDWWDSYYMGGDHNGIISTLRSYTPQAGVQGEALKLDSVEILTPSYSLSTGTVSFKVNWDGTPLTILANSSTPVLWVNSSGSVWVRDASGNTFNSGSLNLILNSWNDVVFAFTSGTLNGGYISIGGNNVSVSWSGTFGFDRVGNVSQSTGTLIDSFVLYSDYLTPEEASSGTYRYYIKYNDATILIAPEGGNTLPSPVVASALDAGMNVISSYQLTPTSKEWELPPDSQYLSLQAGSVGRIIYLPGATFSTTAIPAVEVSSALTVNVVVPQDAQILEIWTMDGRLIHRSLISNKTMDTFVALPGAYYRFDFYDSSNQRSTFIRQINTDSISFQSLTSQDALIINTTKERFWVETQGTQTLAFYSSPTPQNVTLTYELYDPNGTLIETQSISFTNEDFFVYGVELQGGKVKFILNSSSGLNVEDEASAPLFPLGWPFEQFAPIMLVYLVAGSMGFFALPRQYGQYTPAVLFAVTVMFMSLGFIDFNPTLIAILAVLTGIGLYFGGED